MNLEASTQKFLKELDKTNLDYSFDPENRRGSILFRGLGEVCFSLGEENLYISFSSKFMFKYGDQKLLEALQSLGQVFSDQDVHVCGY